MKNILGIDLGTSAVKLIYNNGEKVIKAREKYLSSDTDGWWNALCRAAKKLDLSAVRAIGLSSQVGTYIVDGKHHISWSEDCGKDELDQILAEVSREEFLREISMPHPHIISYPLPRLLYIKKHFDNVDTVCMPKDMLCLRLTGKYVSDKFSWRGLADLDRCEYSSSLLERFALSHIKLPKLCEPTEIIGYVCKEAEKETGIPCGTPVNIGCNDFFSGLIGMGITESGSAFDITGTSEHLGIVTSHIPDCDDLLVSGKYFFENVHYGVTASSGVSLDFGLSLHKFSELDIGRVFKNEPPVFLPYLCGERAPIWDSSARGVFFGIGAKTTPEDMAYATLEGVCFSIYHIYKTMGSPSIKSITVSGGAAKDPLMNLMKASLFNCPVIATKENDASALGAQLLTACAIGDYQSVSDAVADNCRLGRPIMPNKELGDILRRRFEIYRSLYPALKDQFNKL